MSRQAAKCAAIIQARMTSSRLPGKVMAHLAGQPMLGYMLDRIRTSGELDEVCVATTANRTDDPVAGLCAARSVHCFRGDEYDVLDRFHGAANEAGGDILVRLTGDCPMMDPALLDEGLAKFKASNFDYYSNALTRTYPDGLDFEIFTRSALEAARRNANTSFHREHVTPYLRTGFYQSVETGDFSVGEMLAPADFSHLRWTVDTQDDLDNVRAMVARLPTGYGWLDAVAELTRHGNIYEFLRHPASQEVHLRPVADSDCERLYDWVNQPDSIAGSLRTAGPIAFADHKMWFAACLQNDDVAIWIAENPAGEAMGQIRLEKRTDAIDVSIYVASAYRGQGAALSMLQLAGPNAGRMWPGVPLRARIRPDNWSSRSLFVRAGYGNMVVESDHIILFHAPYLEGGAAV